MWKQERKKLACIIILWSLVNPLETIRCSFYDHPLIIKHYSIVTKYICWGIGNIINSPFLSRWFNKKNKLFFRSNVKEFPFKWRGKWIRRNYLINSYWLTSFVQLKTTFLIFHISHYLELLHGHNDYIKFSFFAL